MIDFGSEHRKSELKLQNVNILYSVNQSSHCHWPPESHQAAHGAGSYGYYSQLYLSQSDVPR